MSSSKKKKLQRKKIDRQKKLALNNLSVNNENDLIVLKRKLTKDSLFLFQKENCFRNFCLRTSTNNIFVQFINITVLISSIFLVLETYDDKKVLEISNIFGLVFLGIYIVEFLFKIVAFGFCMGENTYLTDAWNILDLLIIITGAVSLFPQVENDLYFIRVLKIVRPLKALAAIPNMKIFISSLLFSLMDLFIVFIILLFFFIIFALIGLSLWSDIFDYRCRTDILPVNGTITLDPRFTLLCGGENMCNNNASLCLSSKDLWDNKIYFFDSKNKLNNFENELYTQTLNYGFTTFRNFLNSIYIVFQVTTMEGWGNIMFIVMSAHNSILAAIYFISLIILNNYFMLNLLVAILLFNFEKNYQLTEKGDHVLFRFNLPIISGGARKKNGNELDDNINNNLNYSNLHKSGSSNTANFVDKKNGEFSLNENSLNNNDAKICPHNSSNANSSNILNKNDNSFLSGKKKDDYKTKKNNNNDAENDYFDDANSKNSPNAFDSMTKNKYNINKILISNADKDLFTNLSNSIRKTEEKLSIDKKSVSENKLIYIDKNASSIELGGKNALEINNSDDDIKKIMKKEYSSYLTQKNKGKKPANEISFENLSKKSSDELTKNKANRGKYKEKGPKSIESLKKINLLTNSLVEPAFADSARMLLNHNENFCENEMEFNRKREEAEILIEDISFYDRVELLGKSLFKNENKKNNSIIENEIDQVNDMSNKSKSEIDEPQLKFRNRTEIVVGKRPNNNSKKDFKFKSLELSYSNNSPKTVNLQVNKKRSNNAHNNFDKFYRTNKLENKNFKTLLKNKSEKKLNDNLNDSNNSSLNYMSDKKPLKSVSGFTLFDKNTSTNFLLRKMNTKASKVDNSFENSFCKNNINGDNFKDKLVFKSNIFSISNNTKSNKTFYNTNNYQTKRYSDTQLSNRKLNTALTKVGSIERRKTASLAVFPRTNLNNIVGNLIDQTILNNKISNPTLNNDNKNLNNYLSKINNFNNNNSKASDENRISGKDLEKLLSKYRKRYSKIKTVDQGNFNILKPHKTIYNLIKEIPFFINFRKTSAYHKQNKLAFWCYYIINQPIVQYFIYICITINFIILVVERKSQSLSEIQTIELLNKILVFVFIVECSFLVLATGIKNFFKIVGNSVDFALVIFSLVELIFINEQISNKSNTSVASSFKILRIMRILKLIRSWHNFRIMILSIIDTGKRMGNYFILLFIFIYVYAIVGCNIFKGSLRFNKETNKYDKNGEQLYDNFDSFSSAFLNVFYLIIGDSWYNMFFDCLRSDANNSLMTIAYFISLILIGQLCMLNIFMAYLIDNFKISRQELFKNIEVKKKVFNNIPKIGLEKHRKEVVRSHQKNRFKSPFLALVNFFATQHEKLFGPTVILKSKFIFEAKVHISFMNEGKANQSYFRRQRINKKISDNEKTMYDKSEDFEILYKNEAFHFKAKKDLLIDFDHIVNLEMWKKEKLNNLFFEKNEEQLILMDNNADGNSDINNQNKVEEEGNKCGFDLDSLPTDACGIIRNKTEYKSGRNGYANYISKLSLRMLQKKKIIHKGDTVGLNKNSGVGVKHPFDKFREIKSNSHYTPRNIILNKARDNLLNNEINDFAGIYKLEDTKEEKGNSDNLQQNFAKILPNKNKFDILESKADNIITENYEINTNPKKNLCEESKETISIQQNLFEIKIPNSKNFRSKENLRFIDQSLFKDKNKNGNSDLTGYSNKSKAEFVVLNEEKDLDFASEANKDDARIIKKEEEQQQQLEKKVMVPLKKFIKKYEFIQSEKSSNSEQERAPKANKFYAPLTNEINYTPKSNASKYSLSNDDWELNNEVSEENVHEISIKNYELQSVYNEINKDPSFSFDLMNEKKFGKQIKLNNIRRTNTVDFNSLSKNTNLNNIENYFWELDFKYNKSFDTELQEKISNPNDIYNENDYLNNKSDYSEQDINYMHRGESFGEKKEKNLFKNKIKINGDQVILKPRKDKAKNFLNTKINFFGNENLNKEITKEKNYFTLKKAKTSTVEPDSIYFLESSRIPNKTLNLNNFSVNSGIKKFTNTNNINSNFIEISINDDCFSLSPNKNLKENHLNVNNNRPHNANKIDLNGVNEVSLNLNYDFALDKESNYCSESNMSEEIKGCVTENIKGYNLDKILNKTKKLLDLKTETRIKDIRFHSDNYFSFDKGIKQSIEPEKKSSLKAKTPKLIEIKDKFSNMKNTKSQKSNKNNLKKANKVSFNSIESEYEAKSNDNNKNCVLSIKNQKSLSKFSMEDLKDPEFIRDNKTNFNEVLFQCLNNSQNDKAKKVEKNFEIFNHEECKEKFLDANLISYAEEYEDKEQEFIDFDIVLDKFTRNTLGKHKCKNIVESISLKNIFNTNENLKKNYYFNDPKLAQKISQLYLVKKEKIKNYIKDLKSNFNSISFRNSTKSEINLTQIKLEESLTIRPKAKSIDSKYRKSLFTSGFEEAAGNLNVKDQYKLLNVDQEIFLNEQNFNFNENKNEFSVRRKNNSLIDRDLCLLSVKNGINNSDSYDNLGKEQVSRTFLFNEFNNNQLKKHQNTRSKFNLNETFTDNFSSNNNNNNEFSEKEEAQIIQENKENNCTLNSSEYESEKFCLLYMVPNAKNNLISELKKTEFIINLEEELNCDNLFIKVKNLFYKVSLKPLFAEYQYEKKIERDRMSIFNLINADKIKETLAYENLGKEISATVQKATENIIKKTLNEYLEEKAEADENVENKNIFENILQTFHSSLTKKHKFPFIFINNPLTDSRIKEKFLSIFYIFNAKSWEIKNTEYFYRAERQTKKLNFIEKLKTKIKDRSNEQTELKKHWSYLLRMQIKNHILDSSLGIFHKESKFRIFCAKIVLSNYFEFAIMIFILFNCIFLILDNPWNDPEGWVAKTILYTNTIFTFIFMTESVMKIIAFGLIFGQKDIPHENKPRQSFPMEFIRKRKKSVLDSSNDDNLDQNLKETNPASIKSTRRVCIVGLNDEKTTGKKIDYLPAAGGIGAEINKKNANINNRRRSNVSEDKVKDRYFAKSVNPTLKDHLELNTNKEKYIKDNFQGNYNNSYDTNRKISNSNQNNSKQNGRAGAFSLKAHSDRPIGENSKMIGDPNEVRINASYSVASKAKNNLDFKSKESITNSSLNKNNILRNLNNFNKFDDIIQKNSSVSTPKNELGLEVKDQEEKIKSKATLIPSANEINNLKNTNLSNINLNQTNSININSSSEETFDSNFSSSNKTSSNKINNPSPVPINFSNHSGYLNNISNFIDFFIVILGFIDVVSTDDIAAAKYLRTMRMLRSIRPIRIITKNENLKMIITCLIKSIPAIGNILIIGILFIFIYAIVGVNLFKNTLDFYCSNNQVTEEIDCLQQGFNWLLNQQNFNNIFSALKTLFATLTTQNWVWLMNLAYFKTSNSVSVYFYFISFIIFANFFILNLFVSVIVEKFQSLKEKKNKLFSLSEEEKDWIKVQKIMMKFNPNLKLNEDECSYWQIKIHRLITNIKFEILSIFFIFLAIVLLGIQFNGAQPGYNSMLQLLNYGLTFFFNLELLLKLFVYRKHFFISRWNLFDFVIIMLCNVVLIMNILEQLNVIENNTRISTLPGIFRALRILRVLRLIAVYPNLRLLIDTLVYLVPSVGNIGLIMLILFTIYGCIGVNLFGTVPYRENIHDYNNFRNFPNAVLLLFKVTTGDDWSAIMNELAFHDCRKLDDYLSTVEFSDNLNRMIVFNYYQKMQMQWDSEGRHNKYFDYYMNGILNSTNMDGLYHKHDANKHNFNFRKELFDYEKIYKNNNYNYNSIKKSEKKKVSKRTYSVVNRKQDYLKPKDNLDKDAFLDEHQFAYSLNQTIRTKETITNGIKTNSFLEIKPTLSDFYHRNLQSFPNLTLSFNNSIFSLTNETLSKIEDFTISKKHDYFCEMFKEVYCSQDDNITYAMLNEGLGFSCGSDFSYVYFISFIIIGPIFVMNLCVVIVVEGFSESMLENESLLSQSEMDRFISVWVNYDTNFSKMVKPYEMVMILKEIDPPLGLNYDRLFIHNPLRAWKNFKMKNKIKRTLENNVSMFIEEFKNKKNTQFHIKGNDLNSNRNMDIHNVFNSDAPQAEAHKDLEKNVNETGRKMMQSNCLKGKNDFIYNEHAKNTNKNNFNNYNNLEMQQLNSSLRNKNLLYDHDHKHNFKNNNDTTNKICKEILSSNNLKNINKYIFSQSNEIKGIDGLKIVKKGSNTYNCNNFFFNQNLKFWTYNSEVIRIVDFFGFNAKQSPNSNGSNEANKIPKSLAMKDGILNKVIDQNDLYDGLHIHFVDACLSLSKYLTSKKHSILQESLREKVVRNFTKKMWKKKFKLKAEDFDHKKKNVLSENLSLRVLEKIKPKLKNMLENARRNIYIRKLNDEN